MQQNDNTFLAQEGAGGGYLGPSGAAGGVGQDGFGGGGMENIGRSE